jgi:AsmA protein
MKRKTALSIVWIAGLIVLAIVALPFLISADRFRPAIQNQLTALLGRPVAIGHLDFSVLGGDLSAENISIGDDPAFSNSPFIQAKSLAVGVELIPLIFSRAIHIRSIALREPDVVLLRSSSGKWNFSSLGESEKKTKPAASSPPDSSPELTMQKLSISDGRIRIGTAGRKQPETYDGVNLTAENVSYSSSFPFKLEARTPGNGSLEITGIAGPINPKDAAQTPFHASVALHQMDLASSGFLDPASGIAGIVDYQGKIDSDGKTARAEGATQIDKMRVVPGGTPATQPVSVEYASEYDIARQSGALTKGQLRTGKSALSVSGTYDASGDATVLHMKLDAPSIPLPDIQALLPAFGVTLPAGSTLQGGTVKANLSVDGPLDRLVTTGNITMSDAKLSGFGLGSKMGALAAFTGLKPTQDTLIQVLSSNLRITPDGISLDNMNLVVPDLGTITGEGTIGTNQALNFKMRARIAEAGGLAGLASRAGIGGAAGRDIPFLVQGTSSKPVILPDVAGMVKAGVSNLGQSLGQSPGKDQPKSVGDVLNGIFGQEKKQ